jgi:type III secretory pathway component EscS
MDKTLDDVSTPSSISLSRRHTDLKIFRSSLPSLEVAAAVAVVVGLVQLLAQLLANSSLVNRSIVLSIALSPLLPLQLVSRRRLHRLHLLIKSSFQIFLQM